MVLLIIIPIIGSIILIISIILVVYGIRHIKQTKQSKIRLEYAEEEMRKINYELNTKYPGQVLNWEFSLNKDNLNKVHFVDRINIHFIEPCSLQTEAPILPISSSNYYEIKLLKIPSTTKFFIGIGSKQLNENTIPGYQIDSIGLNCHSGILECNGISGKKRECDLVKDGDIVGCFYDPIRSYLYFTLNGESLKKHYFITNQMRLYPSIYADGPCQVQFNFGYTQFKYSKANSYHYGIASSSPLDNVPPEYNHQTDNTLQIA